MLETSRWPWVFSGKHVSLPQFFRNPVRWIHLWDLEKPSLAATWICTRIFLKGFWRRHVFAPPVAWSGCLGQKECSPSRCLKWFWWFDLSVSCSMVWKVSMFFSPVFRFRWKVALRSRHFVVSWRWIWRYSAEECSINDHRTMSKTSIYNWCLTQEVTILFVGAEKASVVICWVLPLSWESAGHATSLEVPACLHLNAFTYLISHFLCVSILFC